jgi:hypothetical protein
MNKAEIARIIKQASTLSYQLVDHAEEDFKLRVEMWFLTLRSAMTFDFACDALVRHYQTSNWPLTPKDLNERWNELTDYEWSKQQAIAATQAKQSIEQDNSEFIKLLRDKFPVAAKAQTTKVKRFSDAELAEMDRKKNASLMHLQIENFLDQQATDE